MEKIVKTPSQSEVIMTELVLPNDTNTFNNLMGGRMLHWMDIASAVAAQKHSNSVVVTASVDNVSFASPVQLGDVVTLKAKVTRAFNSSMEVYIEVTAEDIPNNKKVMSNSAFYTFVTMDENNKPVGGLPEVTPESEQEIELYAGALRRRQLRLVLAKRMHPSKATELKSLFIDE
ncbi:MAG: acyl-CoA thioesterase [Reichenbachiella sp.]